MTDNKSYLIEGHKFYGLRNYGYATGADGMPLRFVYGVSVNDQLYSLRVEAEAEGGGEVKLTCEDYECLIKLIGGGEETNSHKSGGGGGGGRIRLR